jgi:hypothetical protein
VPCPCAARPAHARKPPTPAEQPLLCPPAPPGGSDPVPCPCIARPAHARPPGSRRPWTTPTEQPSTPTARATRRKRPRALPLCRTPAHARPLGSCRPRPTPTEQPPAPSAPHRRWPFPFLADRATVSLSATAPPAPVASSAPPWLSSRLLPLLLPHLPSPLLLLGPRRRPWRARCRRCSTLCRFTWTHGHDNCHHRRWEDCPLRRARSPVSPALGPEWGSGPSAVGGALTAASTASALTSMAAGVPVGVADPEDPPPPIPPSLVVDTHPVVDPLPPPPVAHQGYTVAALAAAHAEHAARQARLREAALMWQREREAADAIAAQIAVAEQLLASPAAHDGGATSSDTVGGVYGVPTALTVGTVPRTIPTML